MFKKFRRLVNFKQYFWYQFYKQEIAQLEQENCILKKSISELVRNWSNYSESFSVIMFGLVYKRQFYDTTWSILYQENGVISKMDIVRHENECFEGLHTLLENCKTVNEIKTLDERSTIYYD